MTTPFNRITLDQVIEQELDFIADRREEPDLNDVRFQAGLVKANQAADLKATELAPQVQAKTLAEADAHRPREAFDLVWREEYDKARGVERTEEEDHPPPGAGALPKALRQQEPLRQSRKEARDMNLTGLALSGGGIRSATFCLGVLQGLAGLGLLRRLDFLSTVSGGGYIGSWLAAWIKREGNLATVEKQLRASRVEQSQGRNPPGKPTEEEPVPIQHLRSYSNYLTPQVGLASADSWTLLAAYLRNFLLNQLLFICALLAFLILPRLGMLFYDWKGFELFGKEIVWENEQQHLTFLPAHLAVVGLTVLLVYIATVNIGRFLQRQRLAATLLAAR